MKGSDGNLHKKFVELFYFSIKNLVNGNKKVNI